MRLFVGEFICGGGLSVTRQEEIPASLWREGGAMLAAVVADTLALSDVHPITMIDPRWSGLGEWSSQRDLEIHEVQAENGWLEHWAEVADQCDVALVIAPENGPLEQIEERFATLRCDWLGCRGSALRLGIDKLQMAKWLDQHQVPTIPTLGADEVLAGATLPGPRGWVTKPINGCGSTEIRRLATWQAVQSDLVGRRHSLRIVQPHMNGRAASCALLCGPGGRIALPPVSQELCQTTFEYLGGEGPLIASLYERAQQLALRAVESLGTSAVGYLGTDLLLGDDPDGGDDWVVEINPRLTTSYVGLRRLVNENLVAMMLRYAGLGDAKPHLANPDTSVMYPCPPQRLRFTADGRINGVADG